MTTTSSPPPPGGFLPAGSPPSVQDAARIMAGLTRPLAAYFDSAWSSVVQVAGAAVMTAAGAGLRLAAAPGILAKVTAAACLAVIAVRVLVPEVGRRLPRFRREPPWAPAARLLLAASPPGQIPAETLAVVGRYLPLIAAARRQPEAFAYLVPCAGPGAHTLFCRGAGICPLHGQLLVLLGEHAAADPDVARGILAHEAGHVTGWTYRAFTIVNGARQAGGWGWAAAGLAGSARGWPGALAAAAVFQAASVLAAWVIEIACDRRAARAEGHAAARAEFGYLATVIAADRSPARLRRTARTALYWAAGPPHPPLPLRRRLATTPLRRNPGRRAEGQAAAREAVPQEPRR